jgi:hypothetical protein
VLKTNESAAAVMASTTAANASAAIPVRALTHRWIKLGGNVSCVLNIFLPRAQRDKASHRTEEICGSKFCRGVKSLSSIRKGHPRRGLHEHRCHPWHKL